MLFDLSLWFSLQWLIKKRANTTSLDDSEDDQDDDLEVNSNQEFPPLAQPMNRCTGTNADQATINGTSTAAVPAAAMGLAAATAAPTAAPTPAATGRLSRGPSGDLDVAVSSASSRGFRPISDVGSRPAVRSRRGGSKGTDPTDTVGNTLTSFLQQDMALRIEEGRKMEKQIERRERRRERRERRREKRESRRERKHEQKMMMMFMMAISGAQQQKGKLQTLPTFMASSNESSSSDSNDSDDHQAQARKMPSR